MTHDEVSGRLQWKKGGPASKYTLYRYDTHGRLAAVYYDYATLPGTFPDTGGDVTYAYDGNSSLETEMVDGSGTSEYTYDIQGRLATYTPPVGLDSGYHLGYAYNNAGQKTETKITNGTATPYDVTYDYFANGWLKEVKDLGTSVASYSYDEVGNRTDQTNHNGTSTVYDYDTGDPRYFLDSITHKHGQTELAKIDYAPTGYDGRDAAGNPRSLADWTGVWSYGYDANNRLTTAVPPNPVPDQPAGGPYEYDWTGNRLHPPADPNPMVYNAADQLVTWPGMHTYTYYPDGSLQYERNAAGTQTMESHTYTPDGLLDTASFDGKTLTNTWDADKNRVGFSVGATSHTLVYDTTAGIPAVIAEDAVVPANGVYYIREPGGELLAMIDPVKGIRYYHFDQLGSTRLLTDADGDVTDDYAYDTYGALLAHNRHTDSVDQPYQYVGQLGYYTHWQEPSFGLMQLGIRFYAPSTAIFTETDAEKGLLEPYRYGGSCPTVNVDPDGRKCVPVGPRRQIPVAYKPQSRSSRHSGWYRLGWDKVQGGNGWIGETKCTCNWMKRGYTKHEKLQVTAYKQHMKCTNNFFGCTLYYEFDKLSYDKRWVADIVWDPYIAPPGYSGETITWGTLMNVLVPGGGDAPWVDCLCPQPSP